MMSRFLLPAVLAMTTRLFLAAALAQDDGAAAGATVQRGQAVVARIVGPLEPATLIERLAQRTGAPIVIGFTELGVLTAADGPDVRVLAVEAQDLARQEKLYGARVELLSRGERIAEAWIDEAELAPLAAALEALMKATRQTSTRLADFEARTQTKSELTISNLSLNGVRVGEVRIFAARTQMPANRLDDLRALVAKAQQEIARAKGE